MLAEKMLQFQLLAGNSFRIPGCWAQGIIPCQEGEDGSEEPKNQIHRSLDWKKMGR
jgi:hypothetical protein